MRNNLLPKPNVILKTIIYTRILLHNESKFLKTHLLKRQQENFGVGEVFLFFDQTEKKVNILELSKEESLHLTNKEKNSVRPRI